MATSSSQTSQLDLNPAEIRYKVDRMNMFPTKFVDIYVTNNVLSYPDVCSFRGGSDWFKLLRLDTPTYPDLSKEFLGSLHLYFADEEYLDEFFITFEMGGVKARLTLEELNHIYGIKRTQCRTHFNEFNCAEFWKKITAGHEYEPIRSRVAEILNPTLRYFYYVIAHTVMGRSNNLQKVCPWDLFTLWGLTIGNHLNMIYFMLKHIRDIVIPYEKSFVMGGLLTPLAEHFGIKLSGYIRYGQSKVDFNTLFDLHMLSPLADGRFLLHFADRPPLQLPAKLDRIGLNKEKNWRLED